MAVLIIIEEDNVGGSGSLPQEGRLSWNVDRGDDTFKIGGEDLFALFRIYDQLTIFQREIKRLNFYKMKAPFRI